MITLAVYIVVYRLIVKEATRKAKQPGSYGREWEPMEHCNIEGIETKIQTGVLESRTWGHKEMQQTEKQEDWQDVQTVGSLTEDDKKKLSEDQHKKQEQEFIYNVHSFRLGHHRYYFFSCFRLTSQIDLDCSRGVNQGWS